VKPEGRGVSGFEPRPNTFIMENNVIPALRQDRRNVILWSEITSATTPRSANNCFIASQAWYRETSGSARTPSSASNATLRDKHRRGQFNVIGAAALILATPLTKPFIRRGWALRECPRLAEITGFVRGVAEDQGAAPITLNLPTTMLSRRVALTPMKVFSPTRTFPIPRLRCDEAVVADLGVVADVISRHRITFRRS